MLTLTILSFYTHNDINDKIEMQVAYKELCKNFKSFRRQSVDFELCFETKQHECYV